MERHPAFTKILPKAVIKGGKEYTILESEPEPESPECTWKPVNNEHSTFEVACCTRICRRSMTSQAKFHSCGKNFRHVNTNTDDLKNCVAKPAQCPCLLAFATVETSTNFINEPRNFQEPSEFRNDTEPDVIKNLKQNTKPYAQNSNKCVPTAQGDLQMTGYRAVDKTTPLTVMYNKCVRTDNKLLGNLVKNRSAPCWKGHVSTRPFTMGTAEYRRFRKDNCKTKLIGGYRVPVCNKARF